MKNQLPTIDLTRKTPRLIWLNGKTFKQGNGGRKNRSGYQPEHLKALEDNKAFDLKAEDNNLGGNNVKTEPN